MSKGYDIRRNSVDEALLTKACDAAKAADKVVIVAGLPDSFESEGYDRQHMQMPANQNALIEAVAAVNPNVIVLLYNGSPVEMPWIHRVKGVLESYLAGQNVGWANRAVLYGDVNPSGRLPETSPLRLEDTPCYLTYGGEGNTAVYSEGVFVGYRWYTSKKQPVLYPFGYGLSYTTFAYNNLILDKTDMDDTQILSVQVDVTNTGSMAGKEVVQLYVAPPKGEVIRPVRELKGFAKVALSPGETKTVTFTLEKRALAYWNTQLNDWHVESGRYAIQICRNADDVVLEEFVAVRSTQTIPRTYSMDTIFMDLDEKAMEKLQKVRGQSMDMFGGDDKKDEGDDEDTITAEMGAALMRNMPLRGMMSFGGMTLSELEKLVDLLNDNQS